MNDGKILVAVAGLSVAVGVAVYALVPGTTEQRAGESTAAGLQYLVKFGLAPLLVLAGVSTLIALLVLRLRERQRDTG